MALTELELKNFKPKEKAYRMADGGGLCIEISPTGSKLWRWRYYYQNKPQVLALGKYPLIGLTPPPTYGTFCPIRKRNITPVSP